LDAVNTPLQPKLVLSMNAIPGLTADNQSSSLSAEPVNVIHRLDPRVRVLMSTVFAVIVVLGQDITMLTAALAMAVVLAVSARLSLAITLRRMLAMELFIIAMLLTLPFTLPGEPLFQWGPLTASEEGVLQALIIVLKANAVILVVLTLVGTLEVTTLGHALHHLRIPAKLVHLLLFTVRYISVLQREYQRLRLAMVARAFVPRSNWHTWRSYGYLIGMLLVRSLERSERVHTAMLCRGFHGHYYLWHHFTMTRLDWFFMVGFMGCSLALLGIEIV
jgi:cobalt/nickel transport system permease protein